ncbi:MAG: hypothetical protein JWM89_3079 [Acidimicrobiales bacterium]|nr:hypothetical protein [Acidimicrobiales bacterium]
MVHGALALSLLLGGTIVALATDVQPAGAAVSGTYTTSFSGVSCPTSAIASTNTSTWGSVTVPAGVTAATFSVIGGGGGGGDTTNSAGGSGGSGGTVTGTVTSLVTAGQVLWAKLGCGGTDSATTVQADGYTKGGAAAGLEGGGGGGSSALCKGTTTAACGGGTMLAIAPGGGGGGTGDANKNSQAGGAGGNGGNTTARTSNSGAGKSGANGSNGAGGNAGSGTAGLGGDSANASTPGTGGAGSDYSNANTIARPRAGAGAGVVPAATPVVAPAANVGAGGAGGVGGATAQNPRMLGGGGGGGLNGGGGGGGGECIGTSTCVGTGTIGGVDTSAAGGGGGSSWALSTVTSPAFASTGTAACGAVGLGATSAGFGGTGNGRGCNGWATVTFTVTSSTGISFASPPTASGTAAGVAFASQPVVRTLDGSGNVVAGAITLTYSGTDSGGGTVTNATLPCATNPVTADASGFAVFSGCSVSAPGSYTITAKNGTSLASVATGTTTVSANNSWSSTASAGSNCASRSTATAGSFSLPATTSAGSVTVRAGGGAGGAGGNDVNSYGGDGGYGGSTTLSNFTVGSNKTLAYLLGCAGTGGAFTNSASLTAAGGTGGAGWGAGSAGGSALTPLAATMKTGGGGGGGGTVACLVASGSSCAASATPTPLAVAGGGAGGGGGGQGFKGAGTGGSGNGGSAPSANEAWYGTGTTGTGMGGSGGVGGLNGVGGTYTSTPNTTGCVPTAVAQGCGSFAGAGGGAGGTGSAGTNGTQQNGWGGAAAAGDNTPGNGGASFGGAGTAGSAGSATTGGAAGVGGNSNKVPGNNDDTTSYIEGGGGAGGGYYGGGGGGADNGHYGNSSAAGGGGGSGWANANLGGTSSFSTAGGTPGIGGSQKATGGDAFSSNTGSDGSIVATYSGNGINVVPVGQTSQNGTTATYDLKTVATAADSATTYTAASLVWSAASLPTGFSVSSAGVITAGPTATAGSNSLTIWVRTSAGTPPINGVSQYWSSVTVPWTVTAPPSTKLAFGTQPGGGGSGAVWGTQPVVQIQDVNSAVVPSDTSTVTIAIKSGSPSGTLTCTGGLSKAAVAGVATFAGCKIDGVTGTTYQLTATDTTPTNLTAANSNQFPIAVGDATKLAFGTQPGGGPSGSVWATQPTVQVLDSGGNLVSTDTSNVTLAKNTGPTGTLACTTNPQAAASGVATFAGCKITGTTGSYTLIASDGALTSIVSNSVAISAALPVANAQTVDARRGFTKNIQLTGSDPNSLPITYSVVTPASKGTVSCSSGGACTYNVTAGQTGDDSFTFKVNNGTSDSVPATVTIHITNDAPTADAKAVVTPLDTAVLITLTGSDLNGDTIVFNPPIGTVPDGTVSGSGSSIQFTPDTGFQGIATFTYTVTDIESQASAPATVTVYVGVVRWVGTVTSAVGGAPLAGIEARLVDNTVPTAADPATIATAVTNASGQYDFGPQLTRGAVDFGNYVIRFVDPANNYIPEWNVDAATRALATNVAADGSAVTVSVNAALVAASRVQGTVTSIGAGHPAVTGLQVRLYKIGVAGSKATTTDANGAYKFELLTAGNYQLWFRDVSSGTWTSEWYDEATDQANATTITVTTGQQVTINEMLAPVIPVPPPVTATVQGTVTATVGGSPVAGVQVRLFNEPYTDSAATTTDANGNYSFPGEESGNYKIWFRVVDGQQLLSEYYNNKADVGTADAIAVDGTTVTANAALDPVPPPPTKGTVSGTVYAANGTTPIAGIQVRLYADPYTSSAATTTDGNGHYSFANRSLTNYKLWFRSLNSTYASEYNENKADLASGDAVTLTGASLVVDASLQPMPPPPPPNASTITGTITTADGITPLAGIQVRLYLNGVASGSTAVLTDANGVYTFTSKAPGDYQLYFRDVTNTYVSEWYDDQVNQAGALPVTASNYTVVTIDARLGHR